MFISQTIKVLQQRLADIKKTLQRELKMPSSSLDNDLESPTAILCPSSSKTITAKNSNSQEEDVNFKYLKHVLIKFLTSREYEVILIIFIYTVQFIYSVSSKYSFIQSYKIIFILF